MVMSKTGKRAAIISGVVLAACLLPVVIFTGWAWYKIRQDLSEPPQHAGATLVPDVPTSVLVVNVTVPLDRIRAQAEALAPKRYSGSGNGPDVCITKVGKICAGTRYDFSASRGAISIGQGPGNTLHIGVPLSVTGRAELRGNGARLLHIQARSFAASTDASADVTLGMLPNWCPRVQVNADLSKLKAKVEIGGHASVDISEAIRADVQKELQSLGQQALSAIKCDDIRNAMQTVWATRSFPLALFTDVSPLYVNIEPVSLGFSGVQVSSSATSFLLSAAARISVSDTAIAAATRPLPAWTAVPVRPGGIQVAIPLRVSYQGLDAHLRSLLARAPLTFPTIAGPGKISVDNLNIYPAGDKLAVGVHVSATLPDSFFDTGGWLYLTARPILGSDGKTVHLSEIGYSKLVDSDVARTLMSVVDKVIRDRLATAGQFDLTDSIARATSLVKTGMGSQGGKMSYDLGDASVKLGRIVLGEDALFVEGLFTSGAADLVLPKTG